MISKYGSFYWIIVLIILLIPGAYSQTPVDRPAPIDTTHSFNVKAFGAKGDGITDDTAAIQAALNAAQKQRRNSKDPGVATCTTAPVVYFPNGEYLISQALEVNTDISGESSAILKQQDVSQNILIGFPVWRWKISNMTFAGGNNQVDIGNRNADSSNIIIDRCSFNNSAGVAVNLRLGTNSALLTVRDCTFSSCNQVLVNWSDNATVTDCWITTSKDMKNKAVIENHGWLWLERIVGVPHVNEENDQRWIDNYWQVTCRDFRFGGEFRGITPVVNRIHYSVGAPDHSYYPPGTMLESCNFYSHGGIYPSSVILDSCWIYGAGNPKRQCAIYCEEVPNQIIVRDCIGFASIPVVLVNPSLNLDSYLQRGRNGSYLQFDISHNIKLNKPGTPDLPQQMVVNQYTPPAGYPSLPYSAAPVRRVPTW